MSHPDQGEKGLQHPFTSDHAPPPTPEILCSAPISHITGRGLIPFSEPCRLAQAQGTKGRSERWETPPHTSHPSISNGSAVGHLLGLRTLSLSNKAAGTAECEAAAWSPTAELQACLLLFRGPPSTPWDLTPLSKLSPL